MKTDLLSNQNARIVQIILDSKLVISVMQVLKGIHTKQL